MDEERKEAMEQAAMLNIAFDVWEDMDFEAREKLLEKHRATHGGESVPSVTLMGNAPILLKKEKSEVTTKEKSKKEPKTDAEQDDEKGETDAGDEGDSGEEGSNKEATPKEQAKDEDDAVPINKIIWMYESEKGWENMGEEKSRQLEEARRAGKQKFSMEKIGRAHV